MFKAVYYAHAWADRPTVLVIKGSIESISCDADSAALKLPGAPCDNMPCLNRRPSTVADLVAILVGQACNHVSLNATCRALPSCMPGHLKGRKLCGLTVTMTCSDSAQLTERARSRPHQQFTANYECYLGILQVLKHLCTLQLTVLPVMSPTGFGVLMPLLRSRLKGFVCHCPTVECTFHNCLLAT